MERPEYLNIGNIGAPNPEQDGQTSADLDAQ